MPSRFPYVGNPRGDIPVLSVQFAKSSPGSSWQLATSAFQIMNSSLAAKYPLLSAPRLSQLKAAEGSGIGNVWRREQWNQPGDGYLYGTAVGSNQLYRRAVGGAWTLCLTLPTGYTFSSGWPIGCANGYWWFAVTNGTVYPCAVKFDLSTTTVCTAAVPPGGALYGVGWVGGSVNRWLTFCQDAVAYSTVQVPATNMSWTNTAIVGTGWGACKHVMTVNGICVWSNHPTPAGVMKHCADGNNQVSWASYRDQYTWWDWTHNCFWSGDWSASTTVAKTGDLSAFNGTAPTWTVDVSTLSTNVLGDNSNFGARGLCCDDGSQWVIGPLGCAYRSPAGVWVAVEDGVGLATAVGNSVNEYPTFFDTYIYCKANAGTTALQKIPMNRDRLYIPAISVPDPSIAGDLGQPYMKVR